MKNRKTYYIAFAITIALFLKACIEPFEVETATFENALVIEATITNELKHQEIILSKTFKFEENGPLGETGATVIIKDDTGNTYPFQESSNGKYISSSKFKAEPNKAYQLFVTTKDNKEYTSKTAQITGVTQIDNINVSKEISDLDVEEFNITVDSYDPAGASKYYRYTYEETYKIIAPFWAEYKLIIISQPPLTPIVDHVKKTIGEENRICYNTKKNKEIILTETASFSENRISKFSVKKIPVTDFSVSHRYSILVKQYVQSLAAYTFYKTLNKFASEGSLLSQSQPGFFNGNVYAVANTKEKVLGFFDVSSVSEKRIFFNYRDFVDIGRPPYPYKCEIQARRLAVDFPTDSSDLIETIKKGDWIFYDVNENPNDIFPGPYLIVPKACGDCTVYGSKIKPAFWVD